jgi:glycosyltransferase involved in cell wall biosynthesis
MRSLSSIKNQTFQDFCVTVVENGHNESHRAIYEPARQIIDAQWLHYPLFGDVAQALQFGLAHTEPSKYLCVMEDDDEWLPTFLEKMIRVWEDNYSNIGLVYCNEHEIDPQGEYCDWTGHPNTFDRSLLLKGNWIHFPTQMWRYDLVMKTGGFDVLTSWSADWDMALRMSAYGTQYLPKTLAIHYWHGANTCLNSDRMSLPNKVIQAKMALGFYGSVPDTALSCENLENYQRPLNSERVDGVFVRVKQVIARGIRHYISWIRQDVRRLGWRSFLKLSKNWLIWLLTGKPMDDTKH